MGFFTKFSLPSSGGQLRLDEVIIIRYRICWAFWDSAAFPLVTFSLKKFSTNIPLTSTRERIAKWVGLPERSFERFACGRFHMVPDGLILCFTGCCACLSQSKQEGFSPSFHRGVETFWKRRGRPCPIFLVKGESRKLITISSVLWRQMKLPSPRSLSQQWVMTPLKAMERLSQPNPSTEGSPPTRTSNHR